MEHGLKHNTYSSALQGLGLSLFLEFPKSSLKWKHKTEQVCDASSVLTKLSNCAHGQVTKAWSAECPTCCFWLTFTLLSAYNAATTNGVSESFRLMWNCVEVFSVPPEVPSTSSMYMFNCSHHLKTNRASPKEHFRNGVKRSPSKTISPRCWNMFLLASPFNAIRFANKKAHKRQRKMESFTYCWLLGNFLITCMLHICLPWDYMLDKHTIS